MSYPIPKETLQQNIIALGKTGAGKSSALRSIVEPMLDDKMPVCIIDPKGDWWGLKLSANGKNAGYPMVIFGGKHADVPINEHSGAHVAELFAIGNRPCIIDLRGWMPAQRSQFFIDFASTLFQKTAGKRWLLIDEIHNFAPKGKVLDPLSGKCLHWANRLASEGRGLGLNIIGASQRPQKVHNDLLTSCETLIALRVLHASDRGAYKDWIDGCGDVAKGKEMLATIANLKRGTGFVWSPEIEFGPELVKFPMFTTYDSFKPQDEGREAKLTGWADVNLDEVKAKLTVVIQEAEANDPRKLKARIAELERELKKQKDVAADAETINAAEQRGFERGCALAREAQHTVLSSLRSKFESLESNFSAAFLTALNELKPEPIKYTVHPQHAKLSTETKAAMEQMVKHAADKNGSTSVAPSVRKILDVIHGSYPVSLSFEAAARRAGISKKSSAYGSYKTAVEQSGEVELNQSGRIKSLPEFAREGSIASGAGVDVWVAKLPPSYGRMLKAIQSNPGIGKDDIAAHADISPSSSGLGTGLKELMDLALIECSDGYYSLAEGLS